MVTSLGRYLPEQFIFKVSLLGSDPLIWRRVEVHSGMTLHELHYVMQCLFGWNCSHLYQFHVTPGGKLTNKAFREAELYDYRPPGIEADYETHPAEKTILSHIFSADRKQIVYEYDFGDSWLHLVKLEKRTAGGEPGFIPVCLAGENAAPLDDMGGICGYYDYLEAMADETHERHEHAVEWMPEGFDPSVFDLKDVNRMLAGTFKPVKKRPARRRKKS
jgi:hypothetical protein